MADNPFTAWLRKIFDLTEDPVIVHVPADKPVVIVPVKDLPVVVATALPKKPRKAPAKRKASPRRKTRKG